MNKSLSDRSAEGSAVQYQTLYSNNSHDDSWMVSGNQLVFSGNGSSVDPLGLVNAGDGKLKDFSNEFSGNKYTISMTVCVQEGTASDRLGFSILDDNLGAPILECTQLKSRSTLNVEAIGNERFRDLDFKLATSYTIQLVVDERQSPAGFEVFVDGALKHKGSVTFKNTSRHVCITVQDKDGNMTATVDDFRIEAFPGRKTLGLICAANL